ncbi:MAG: nucleoside 2-deoxyribosyltransferase [Streptomycetaceae bacterium]|nr:nucleoside 2-deoxyribosyltransferase [Streptomycetaceae bacterium]
MKAYIAAPLFNDAEKAFNLQLADALAGIGIGSYLPQRDGGEAAPLIRQGLDEHTVRQRLFQGDVRAVRECDLFVMVLDGRVPDEGVGMAHAFGKPCFGLQTDCRRFGGTDSNNLMIDYALSGGTERTVDDLLNTLTAYIADAIEHAATGPHLTTTDGSPQV